MTLTVLLCFALAVLEGFDIQALGVAAPHLVRELSLSPDQMGWIFAISNVGLVLGSMAGGRLADRYGRKRMLVASTVLFSVFTLLIVFANGFLWLFVARFMAGLGFGASLPNMMALASELSAPEKRARTASLVFCGMPLGGGTVALLTQLMPPGYDWRVLFIIGGVLPLAVAVLLQKYLVETLVVAKGHEAARVPVQNVLFGEGRAGVTLLIWAILFPTLLILYLMLNWLPLLAATKGFPPEVAPRAALAFNYSAVIGAIVLGRLVDRHGHGWTLALAFLGVILSLAALAASTTLAGMVTFSGAAGFFLLGANYAMYGVGPAYYPPSIRGTGAGAAVAVGRAGSVVGPLLAGFALGSGATPSSVIAWLIPAAIIGGAAAILLGRSTRPLY